MLVHVCAYLGVNQDYSEGILLITQLALLIEGIEHTHSKGENVAHIFFYLSE